VEALRAVNGIGPKSRLPDGHLLLVPAQRPTPEAEAQLGSAVFTTVPQGRTFFYKVQKGETLPAIAGRYGVTAQDLRGWNTLASNSVKAGQQLRITSDLAPNVARAKRASGKPVVAKVNKPAPVAKSTRNGKTAAAKSPPRSPAASVTASR
jgi:membrane-bound lytic murein transglycosylase D